MNCIMWDFCFVLYNREWYYLFFKVNIIICHLGLRSLSSDFGQCWILSFPVFWILLFSLNLSLISLCQLHKLFMKPKWFEIKENKDCVTAVILSVISYSLNSVIYFFGICFVIVNIIGKLIPSGHACLKVKKKKDDSSLGCLVCR